MSKWSIEDVDVEAYGERVGLARPSGEPSIEALRRLHRAHVTAIPFENLEPFVDAAPSLVLGDIATKLVERRRGGYCFEQNLLFAAVLERLGYRVDRLAARVRMGRDTASVGPRTHMALRVRVPGVDGAWLADVGFGAAGPYDPVPLDGEDSRQGPWTYAVRDDEEGLKVLFGRGPGVDGDLYSFTFEPQHHSDYVVANHFTGAYPRSPFVVDPFLGRIGEHERVTLRGTTLTVHRASGTDERTIAPAEVVEMIGDRFGLSLSDEEQRRIRARLEGRRARSAVERVRETVVDAMVAAHEEAGMQGLCGEGRFELAVDRGRNVGLV